MTSVLTSLTSFFGSKPGSGRKSYESSPSSFSAGPSSLLPNRPPSSRSPSGLGPHSRTSSFDDTGYGYSESSFAGQSTAYPPSASYHTPSSSSAALHSPDPSYPPAGSPFASPASYSRAKINGGPLIEDSAATPTASYPTLRQTFNRISILLNADFPELLDTLSYPCTEEDFGALDDVFGRIYTMPRDVRESMACHDGQDIYSLSSSGSYRERQARGLVWGLWLLASSEIGDHYRHWRLLERKEARGEQAVDDPFAPAARPGLSLPGMSSCPAGWVREEYSHPGWIPLLTDGLGNYVGVDLDPPPTKAAVAGETAEVSTAWGSLAGRPGQVIAFGRDVDCKTVLFPGWGPDGGWARFLSSFADDLENGEFGTLGDGQLGSFGADAEEGDGDGLGDVGYFDDGADASDMSFAEGRSSSAAANGRGRGRDPSSGSWSLRGDFRGMGIIEALCARSRQRWAEVGLRASGEDYDSKPRRFSQNFLPGPGGAKDLDRRDSTGTVRPPSPNLMLLDPAKVPAADNAPAPSVNGTLDEPLPMSPQLTVSPPSPQQARMGKAPHDASRRGPPPPPAALGLPTMSDLHQLSIGEDVAGEHVLPVTTASPRVSSDRRLSRHGSKDQQPDLLPMTAPRSPSPRPVSPSAQAGLGISNTQPSPIEVVVQSSRSDGA